MPKPQATAKLLEPGRHPMEGWRVVLVCPVCARHFMVAEAEAAQVRYCPWCAATE